MKCNTAVEIIANVTLHLLMLQQLNKWILVFVVVVDFQNIDGILDMPVVCPSLVLIQRVSKSLKL